MNSQDIFSEEIKVSEEEEIFSPEEEFISTSLKNIDSLRSNSSSPITSGVYMREVHLSEEDFKEFLKESSYVSVFGVVITFFMKNIHNISGFFLNYPNKYYDISVYDHLMEYKNQLFKDIKINARVASLG
jgi:hypothetical protein